MKNHEIHLICSIPRSECSNKYYEFISCLCTVEPSNEAFDTKIMRSIQSAPFPEVNATINIMNLFHAFVWLNKALSF